MPLDFKPDLDPTTPGILVAATNLIPGTRGYRSAYSAAATGNAALAAACQGAAACRKVDDSIRLFAGTAAHLYEQNGTSWTDVTRVVGGNYATSTARWRFAQQGNLTLAVNQYDVSQYSIGSGAFANLTAMPKARHVVTSGDFVMIAGTDEGIHGDDPTRWWCSGISDYTNWTPGVAAQCATAQWVDTPGPISALRTLGEFCVLFKARSIAVLQYQGPPVIWTRRTVSYDVGTVGAEAVIQLPFSLAWIGFDNIYVMDASFVPQPIGAGIKEWFFNRIDKANYGKVIGLYDRYRSMLYWWYPANGGGGALTEYIGYNLLAAKWGVGTQTIEAALEWIAPSGTFDNLWAGLTFDTVPNVSFDSLSDSDRGTVPTVFDATHTLCTLTGSATGSSFTTGYVGDDSAMTLVRRVQPKFLTAPASATMTPYWKQSSGGADTSGSPVTMGALGRFDHLRSARWHKFKIDCVGDCEVIDIGIDTKPRSGQ